MAFPRTFFSALGLMGLAQPAAVDGDGEASFKLSDPARWTKPSVCGAFQGNSFYYDFYFVLITFLSLSLAVFE